ncbi:MAG TPA: GerMN domain-containing protein [Candidatus Mediterraneibacter norfolkensis]|nr:GerMN domain-containing protein [Candidatus Mediterraneibacter norfolkensis]
MKRIRKICPLVCICVMLILTACSGRTDVGDGESYIYCLNTDRTDLVKISYEIDQEDTLEAAESVLEELKKPAEEIEYTAAIPDNVEVNGCSLKGSILSVDFDSAYLQIEKLEEKLVRAAVVQSLLRIEGIDGIMFTVDSEPLRDSDGNIIGLMNKDDFVENTGSSPSSYQTDTLHLYFANKAGDGLVEQEMDVRYSSNVSKEKLIVEKLIQGPSGTEAYPTINPNTNLLSVTTKDGICYVNFDSTFLTAAYDVYPEITVYSIVNSLVEGTDAVRVQITINGETNASYMETVDLSQPLQEDMDWVEAAEDEE